MKHHHQVLNVKRQVINDILRGAYTRDPFPPRPPDPERDTPSAARLDYEYACLVLGEPPLIYGTREIPGQAYIHKVVFSTERLRQAFSTGEVVGIAHTHACDPSLSEGDAEGTRKLKERLRPKTYYDVVLARQDTFTDAASYALEEEKYRELARHSAEDLTAATPYGRALMALPRAPPPNPRSDPDYIDTVMEHFTNVTLRFRDQIIGLYDIDGKPVDFEILE